MKQIFLSHNHRDKAFVRRLGIDLQRLGANVWLDDSEIGLGDSIVARVQHALTSADYVAVILSPHSVQSKWVQRELEVALNQELKTGETKILPLLLSDCSIPAFLEGRMYADFRDEHQYEVGLASIARRLKPKPALGGLAAPDARTLSQLEATERIEQVAATGGIRIHGVTETAISVFSTRSFKARARDGKGVIYCHSAGARVGETFYVRKGIGWYYEYVLGGSGSLLGLPTSNEEWTDSKGHAISVFEGGYIQWAQATSSATAVQTAGGVNRVIGDRRL
jgi:hypothetical protein